MRFVEQVKYMILNPLRLDQQFQDIVPLINVATEFMELGWLRGVGDLEAYLLAIAKV